MFKLQVVLVPPSLQNAATPFGFASSTADSSQLLGTAPMMGSTLQRNGDTTLPYPPSISGGNTSIFPSHLAQIKRKKFLHFTKSANSLLELSFEIIEKCDKMYPSLDEEVEILSLQDNSGCDLDPDFLVKDVFNIDNTVRVILKNELNIDDSTPVSLYRNKFKKQKLNKGTLNHLPQSQSQTSASLGSSNSGGILKIAKKRSSASGIRHPTNSNMRISTPLAHQIYPPPQANYRAVSNNSEDEDAGERSFLPPPAQPQSPPIRISSGMGISKKIKSGFEEDSVSRSETVDPDKSKQQRLLSGTPIRPTMTPNRVTLTGQRVVSDRLNNNNRSIFSTGTLSTNRQPSSALPRITSGMLSIPEPKIAEIEKELREGPSSPASVLPAVPSRIPMKKPYQSMGTNPSEDEYSSSEDPDTDTQTKITSQRQTSIADNNGSPVKETPHRESGLQHFLLAELPKNARPLPKTQRETSLEAKVQQKSTGALISTKDEVEPIRKESFSDDEEMENEQEEEDQQMESEIGIIDGGGQENDDENNEESQLGIVEKENRDNDDEDLEGDDTVLINKNTDRKVSEHTSIPKGEFLKYMDGDSAETPSWYPKNSQSHDNPQKSKPYTTVLYNDIDNSKPDPRNIMPKRIPRDAARKAAELLSGKQVSRSDTDTDDQPSSSFDDSSSGIETDEGFDSDNDNNRISVSENNSVRTLTIHPLKEKVIPGPELPTNGGSGIDRNTSAEASNSESEYSVEEMNHSKSARDVAEAKVDSSINGNGIPESKLESDNESQEEISEGQSISENDQLLPEIKANLSSSNINPETNKVSVPITETELRDETALESARSEERQAIQAQRDATFKAEEAKEKAEKIRKKAEQEAEEKTEKEIKEAKANAEKKAKETKEKIEKEAKEAKAKAEKEAKEARVKAEKEAKEARVKAEKEAKEARVKAEKEAKEARIKAEKAAKEARIKAEKVAKEARVKAEKAAKEKADKEAKQKAEQEAKQKAEQVAIQNQAKNSKEEVPTRAKVAQKTSKQVKEDPTATRGEVVPNTKASKTNSKAESTKNNNVVNASTEDNQKLLEMKAKFTKARTYVPVGLVSQKISRSDSDSSEETDSSDEASSSEYSNSSSDEEGSPNSKKAKRLIVNTPRGSLNTTAKKASNKATNKETSTVENAPQSTQNEIDVNQATPNRVPITKLIEVSSPLNGKAGSPKSRSIFKGLPQKVRPSLSSLSDLASRGVPDVREQGISSSQIFGNNGLKNKNSLSDSDNDDGEEEGNDDEDSRSDSASDSDSIDSDSESSSSSEENSFISAKSASSALGKKKKKNGGFASLIKDFKRG